MTELPKTFDPAEIESRWYQHGKARACSVPVERMPDMQRAGDVGRRVDDRPRLGAGAIGTEQALAFPMLIPAGFDFGGVEGLGSSVMVGGFSGNPRKLNRCRSDRLTVAPPAYRAGADPSETSDHRYFSGEFRHASRIIEERAAIDIRRKPAKAVRKIVLAAQ